MMTVEKMADVLCDLIEEQKNELVRLLGAAYESGLIEGAKEEARKCEAFFKGLAFDTSIKDKCDGCKTQGPSLDLEEADLELFVGPGKYCQFCRMAHIDKMLERIEPVYDKLTGTYQRKTDG